MEEKIYPHLRAVDKDDVIAILRNYESEVRRSDNKNRMVMADTISHCIVEITGMDMMESVPVDFIETEIGKILKVKKDDAQTFAMHLESLVNSWRKRSKAYLQPNAVENFISWACRWTLEQDDLRNKDKYLQFMQNLINAWNEREETNENL